MIVEAIFNALAFIALGIIKLFPTIPHIDTSFLDGFIKVVSLIDTFVSLRVLSACFFAFFLFSNIQLCWSIVMWVVRKLPFLK